ncbi:carboxymuconolactone decarboxylase family protein [Streptomyces diastatochromogenes]|uniref:carboxymuconolactone decarboxylase family protein n=1 Tax=Streptomyces diastatochromogenes TaxID=42236 RepID=UPI003663785B
MTDEHHHRPDHAAADTGPRLAPLPEDDWDPSTRELLAPIPRDADGQLANVFTTLVRHPGLFRHFLPFGSHLLRDGRLPDRTRELLILRTACNTRAGYEWGRHVPLARAAGVTDEEIRRVAPARTPRGGRRPTPVCCVPPTNCTGRHGCRRPRGPRSPPTTTRHN